MDLTYNELRKKDVINVADGRCLGRIVNANISFPKGVIVGIMVPATKRRGLFCFFDKSTLYISVSNIIKIGGDVILVDLRCGENCMPNTTVKNCEKPPKKPSSPCQPSCPPPCPPPYSQNCQSGQNTLDLSDIFDEN